MEFSSSTCTDTPVLTVLWLLVPNTYIKQFNENSPAKA